MAVLRMQVEVEDAFLRIARSTGQPSVVIFDRGVMDVEAYLPPATWLRVCKSMGQTTESLSSRYDMVLHLVTAAKGAERFYTLKNNTARTETIEQARHLDSRVMKAWTPCDAKRKVVDNSSDFEGKLNRALEHVKQFLHVGD
eukprot:gene5836-8936_t